MYRKEVNAQSPLRILDKSIHGGLGPGNLGVVMARAGVGKTACLVQIGLDDLMRERAVLHVALEQTVEHVQSWYDALFDDLAARTDLQDAENVRALLGKNRIIQSFVDHDIWPARLEKAVEMFKTHLDFKPATILVDGYNWSAHSVAENAAMIGAFKAQAKLLGAELWISAQSHRESATERTGKLAAPWDQYQELFDVALLLEPKNHHVSLRLLVDHGNLDPAPTHLVLHPDTLRIVPESEDRARAVEMPPSGYTLLSGGAKGAEAQFGACAERWGLAELNFSFEGRNPARTRGVVRLTEDELAEGAVSSRYLEAHMHRAYPQTPLFQKTLQTIWHQVNTAGEVFSVGTILEDKTVKGGTGWAAELARHWKKPVHVFDQERKGWYTWDGHDWVEEAAPTITSRRFTGTGTRFLSEDGQAAVESLFERSFGAPQAG
jgi:KaiC/GvpD/RAD55 family RecA-like ATPase